MSSSVALMSACALACGSRTPRPALASPGTDGDDGAGQLAAASSQLRLGGADDSTGFGPETRAEQVGAAYGYGGLAYGGYGATYGGYLYGGYVPYGAQASAAAMQPAAYSGIGVTDGGSITGTVRWPRPPAAPAVLSLPGCGELANPTLSVGHGGAVGDVIVYLARVDRGRAVPVAGKAIQVGGAIERRGCALVPTVQVATPVPSALTIVNADAGHINVMVGVGGALAGKGVALALDEGTSRTTPLAVGTVRVADDAGALIPAWVVALAHPYYTLTDGEGRFRLDDVPAGTYDLVVWHAPVVVGVKDGKVIATAPIEVRRTVSVKPLAATPMTIDLPIATR